VTAVVALTAMIAPGRAATVAGPDAQYYRSAVTGIEPAMPGVEFMVHDNAGSVMLTNASGTKTITVLGYSGEDYLKITPTKVYENVNSLTAALNKSQGKSAPPARLSSGKKLPVKWSKTADGNSVMWRDFRVRWTATERPPSVAADPYHSHQVFAWALQIKVDRQPALVRGTVTWTGIPPVVVEESHYPVAIALGVAVLLGLVSMIALSTRRRRRSELARVRSEPEYSTSRFIGVRN
jgi:hypothetical protein